jgi:hypothetical protein
MLSICFLLGSAKMKSDFQWPCDRCLANQVSQFCLCLQIFLMKCFILFSLESWEWSLQLWLFYIIFCMAAKATILKWQF